MDWEVVPFRSPLQAYEQHAESLLAGHRAADSAALDLFHRRHPRFLDEKIKWLPKPIPDSEIRDATLSLDDARLTTARYYEFRDWPSLAAYVEAVAQEGPVFEFESAVEAVVNGGLGALQDALRRNPALVRARSTRVCKFDPPVHRATLLHYVAANGVEGHRQKTPPNAVEIARALLEAGAEPDALADMYGAECTTMSMLVSSSHPARAGLQVPLVELLLDFGADIEGRGTKKWGGPLSTALAFGMNDAAKALVKRGARIDLPAAAGLGLADDAARLLPLADAEARHRSLSLAAQHAQAEMVRLLLDAGEDPNRYNLEGNHAHSTPLHQAVLTGNETVVRLLVERGARLDIRDTIWHGTPLGWALYGGGKAQAAMAACLRSLGAEE
ncbi:MAG TPA: ankyrin repeat domain-containing protein [Bryobacteraceae bacterium]|jgi:ankyrin repeat protein|nr:ankyrin repeat domain-containing protein [Bryobacteraceae bacterium]